MAMRGKRRCRIEVTVRRGGGPEGLRRYVRRRLGEAWVHLPRNRLEAVSVVLVGDALMSELHRRSHGDATPTDVLTYELEYAAGGDVSEGEIVVCVPEARRRVGADIMGLRREVLLYALHGVLHLCGMDDGTEREFARMHRKEDEILTRIGVGAVFDAEGRAARRGGGGGRSRA